MVVFLVAMCVVIRVSPLAVFLSLSCPLYFVCLFFCAHPCSVACCICFWFCVVCPPLVLIACFLCCYRVALVVCCVTCFIVVVLIVCGLLVIVSFLLGCFF